ncbi:4Fe-4S dicluster domain-containing protein [Desulfohalovibrio reitneri]|uniref:4Fe-4S dicluster domain-containing protein n=1 Tax=Desulfohalovibrio reitneri TaxID=1307759 RepID=UPI0004A6D806|nr:4Fe-4S dicluster domain-containing protein [Desulfohalovibrio reitneri]
MPKVFLIDTSRCTACRGCQLACKEWHELEPNTTYQYGWGSHQNPKDLNPNNYKLVRFIEHMDGDGVVRWNFFPDQCRHCVMPPCKDAADMYMEGAIIKDDKTGAVLFTGKTSMLSREAYEVVRDACPYDIPRRDIASGMLSKCTMCIDRVRAGMLPACVKVCPTGAMNFGERDKMLDLADERLKIARRKYPEAMLADARDVNVIFLLTDKPENYWKNSVASASPRGLNRKRFLAGLTEPLRRVIPSRG